MAVPALIAALKDPSTVVRRSAAAALGDIRDPRSIEPLRAAAHQEADDSTKNAIAFAIKLHTEVPLLVGALDDKDSVVRGNSEYLLWLFTGKRLGSDKKAWAEWYVNRDNGEVKNSRGLPDAATVAP